MSVHEFIGLPGLVLTALFPPFTRFKGIERDTNARMDQTLRDLGDIARECGIGIPVGSRVLRIHMAFPSESEDSVCDRFG